MERDVLIQSEKMEFAEFKKIFHSHLRGCRSFEEAFTHAANSYKKHFNKVPYQNCQSFLSDLYKSLHDE